MENSGSIDEINRANGRSNNAVHNPPKRLKGAYRFFCWCSGANLDVLRNYPTDYNKHFGTGTAVMMTGVFAFISSAYAISAIFKGQASWLIVTIFGLAWALFIFFLDRYLVSSLRKTRSLWNQALTASPRILLAILIGLTIARPLELKIFEDEIQEYLRDEKREQIAVIDEKYTRQLQEEEQQFNQRMRELQTGGSLGGDLERKGELERLIKEGNDEVQAANDEVQCECNGVCGTKKVGRGPACRQLEREYERIKADYQSNKRRWENEIRELNGRMIGAKTSNQEAIVKARDDWEARKKEIITERDSAKVEKGRGFATSLLAQHEALTRLSNEREGVSLMILVVTILFVFVEVAPILVKLMAEAGPYDQAIEDLEYQYISESRQRRYLTREELKLNKGLISRMAIEQREVIRKAIDEWKRKQMEIPEDEFIDRESDDY